MKDIKSWTVLTHRILVVEIHGETKRSGVEWFTGSEVVRERQLGWEKVLLWLFKNRKKKLFKETSKIHQKYTTGYGNREAKINAQP